MDFRLTEEQRLLAQSVREFAETEIRPHVREWDEAQHFPSEVVPTLAALGLMGIQVPEEYGGAGHVGRRLLHLHRGAGARRSRRRAVGGGAQRALLGAHLHVRHRGAEAAVPRAARARREDRRLGADRVDLGQRRRRHADDGGPRRRRLGVERREDVHDARPRRRRHGRDGGHRSRRPGSKGISAFIVERGRPG